MATVRSCRRNSGKLEPPAVIFDQPFNSQTKGIAMEGRTRYAYDQLQKALKNITGIQVLLEEVQSKQNGYGISTFAALGTN